MNAGDIKAMATRRKRGLGAAALLALLGVPAAAQMGFSDSYTFLKAVRERDGPTVTELSANPSSNAINARDPGTGEGALHMMVRARDFNWLVFLLTRGARPDLQSNDGSGALHFAARIGWVEGAQQLLARGAGVDLVNSRGETPLILAVQRRDIAMVRLLLSQGADPAKTDSVAGYSALDYARQDRRSAAILRLLETEPTQARRQRAPGPPVD